MLDDRLSSLFGSERGSELTQLCRSYGVDDEADLEMKIKEDLPIFSEEELDIMKREFGGGRERHRQRKEHTVINNEHLDGETEDMIQNFINQADSETDREPLANALRGIGKPDAVAVMRKDYREARCFTALAFTTIGSFRTKQRVRRFVEENRLEGETDVVDALHRLKPRDVAGCLKPLTEARDPIAVIRARINRVLRELGRPVLRSNNRDRRERDVGRKRRRSSSESRSGRDRKRTARRRASSESVSCDSQDIDQHTARIDEFVRENCNDDAVERTLQNLKELPMRAAVKIMAKDLSTAKNKTAVIFSRINDARSAGPRTAERIDAYCRKNRLDDDTEDRLRCLPKLEALYVMDKDYSHLKDPNSMVLASCKNAKGAEDYISRDDRVESFIKGLDISEEEESALRIADSKTFKKIMKKADTNDKNETLSRISKYVKTVTVCRNEDDPVIGLDFLPCTTIINKTMDGTPAERAGIRSGWRVLAVNDRPILSKEEAANLAGTLPTFTITLSTV
eukprot:TRINITY_DN5705_c1_g1_i1.p1 TRINITY_DN5705_c1_g1~~TRINITY_DN5705_c1_g1_i1.p1  ORF type:complete len:533 (+),score=93.69 TRINITY_DN5705_c1_g1_i1:64-1599(+)